MSKKRGLSVEEKRTKMMEIFYESKDIFQLKELEKIAPRDKKITCQSVKDVLQSLVDDAMVDSDRIGTSNYFWAFPSKALHARECKIRELEGQLQDATNKKNSLEESVKTAGVGRETTEKRSALLSEIEEFKSKRKNLQKDLDLCKECDPDVIKHAPLIWLPFFPMSFFRDTELLFLDSAAENQNIVAKDAANRWTDNVFSIKCWARDKFGFEDNQIDKTFSIPDDLDYIE
uniref:Meiotic nuclear division protein 1 homolog n=1 Tax=Eptatretus burgeri TaxID=7764 RepID=A0A8C4X201_EPTBU